MENERNGFEMNSMGIEGDSEGIPRGYGEDSKTGSRDFNGEFEGDSEKI